MLTLKRMRREYILEYEDRKYLDVKNIIADIALERDDNELLKLSVMIGKVNAEVTKMNNEEDNTSGPSIRS